MDNRTKNDKLQMATAFVLGANGAVGRELVAKLVAQKIFSKIVLIGRRKLELTPGHDDEDADQRVVEFDRISDYKEVFDGATVGFCALGTTRSAAGKDGFYKVDHDYIVNSARVAKDVGCEHFSLVSSQGADVNSFMFYLKTKGETERDVASIGFRRLTIVRPGLLENRHGARLVERVSSALLKPIKLFRPTALSISTSAVAKAMIFDAVYEPNTPKSVDIIDNATLHQLAADFDRIYPTGTGDNK